MHMIFFIAWYIYSRNNSNGLIHVYFGLRLEPFIWNQPKLYRMKFTPHICSRQHKSFMFLEKHVDGQQWVEAVVSALQLQEVSFPRLWTGTEKMSCLSVRADKLFLFHTISTEEDTGVWSPRYEPLMARLPLCYSFVGVLVCEHLQPLITQRLVVAETCNDICPDGTEAISLLQLLSLCCPSAPWQKL